MRSILTVTVPATDTALTTLARVKSELNITVSTYDTILGQKIDEASSDIEAFLGFVVSKETVAETFWQEQIGEVPEFLLLDRTPVGTITSVVVDGVTIDASLYRADLDIGQLYALDTSGFPYFWVIRKSAVVTYAGGYIPPSETNSDLPAGIQGACVALVTDYWASRGRDPTLKSEEAPGIMRYDYWVGAVGESGELPPAVVARLAPYRRAIA